MKSVLFVCLGNICRSTMAEAVFRHIAREQNIDILVDSCGTGGYHVGEIPHLGTRKELEKNKISWEGIKSRKITKSDFEKFDYIIAMDDNNVYDILAISNKKEVQKLTDFCTEREETEVPDPYYYNNFDQVFDIVIDGCKGLLENINTHL